LTSKTISAAQSIQKQIGIKERQVVYPRKRKEKIQSNKRKRVMNEFFFFNEITNNIWQRKSKRKMQQEKRNSKYVFRLETTLTHPNSFRMDPMHYLIKLKKLNGGLFN